MRQTTAVAATANDIACVLVRVALHGIVLGWLEGCLQVASRCSQTRPGHCRRRQHAEAEYDSKVVPACTGKARAVHGCRGRRAAVRRYARDTVASQSVDR